MPYFNYNNKRVHYIDEGKGKAIVLLAGNTASSAVYKGEIEFYSKEFRVICPDYIGYGKSDRVEKFSYDFWWVNAKMTCELMKSLGIKEWIAIGSSGGGIIAINMSIIEPHMTKGVIADSISDEYVSSELAERVYKERKEKSKEQCMFWKYAQGEDWEQIVELDTKMIYEASKKGESIFKGKLEDIKCPVLIIGSLVDEAIPSIEKAASNISSKILTSKVILYPKGNHPFMWSCSHIFRKESINFINEISSIISCY
ncbi:alpha/beta fold hydrolase [Vallitalea guaymasensis]|uniref:Alpha/beta hydrolase n=1 Tax=Vallitalea guaymasensis TaxID=1185412 RepID=A0A8J8M9C5_9FIRM|nr:alpha/beta hydrolase [Vallitalea guaymasensis]QUH28772.1 alpha/beta hydrolase [Vallitalea guaymasensis]